MKLFARALLPAAIGLLGYLGQPGPSLVPTASAAEPESADKDANLRRFALLVGANDGGSERERLRYAETDAELLAKALTELGGVDARDRVTLTDPDPAALEQALGELAKRVAAAQQAGERVQLIFYYSGHSDETGLLLGGVHFDYKRLRKLIDQIPADVRIAVLDSCSSGAFTRFKGGKKQAPFLAGSAAQIRGHAYLTSSSADEVAQESDRIGGSFFTHFLVTGLRGAADADGDRRVTLDEAYRFAFDETLARTEATAGGPQHAAYDIQLAGTGDLVMTDLRSSSAKLEIQASIAGRIYVRDRRGRLAAELFKTKGSSAITLALEPGNYTITIDDGQRLNRAEVAVRSGKTTALELGELEDIPIEATRLRGDADQPERDELPKDTRFVPFNIGIAPGVELNTSAGRRAVVNNLSISFGATGAYRVDGLQTAIAAAWTKENVRGIQAAVGSATAKGRVSGLQAAIGLTLTSADMRGVQTAAVTLARQRMVGLQVGALAWARRLEGVQLGAVSLASEGKGLQAGLVSVSKGELKGLQIGLVTYADQADAAIALVPITKQGGVHVDVWTSDAQLVNVALRFRARKTHSFISGSIHPFDKGASWSTGLGFGGALFKRPKLRIELDNAVQVGFVGLTATNPPFILDTLRLTVGWTPFKRFALWGGVTGNVMLLTGALGREDFTPGYFSRANLAREGGDVAVKVWPGFALGFEF